MLTLAVVLALAACGEKDGSVLEASTAVERADPVIAGGFGDSVVLFGGRGHGRLQRIDGTIIGPDGTRRIPPAPFEPRPVAVDAVVVESKLLVLGVQCIGSADTGPDSASCSSVRVATARYDFDDERWQGLDNEVATSTPRDGEFVYPSVEFVDGSEGEPLVSYLDTTSARSEMHAFRGSKWVKHSVVPKLGFVCRSGATIYNLVSERPTTGLDPAPTQGLGGPSALRLWSYTAGKWTELAVPKLERRSAGDDPALGCNDQAGYLVHGGPSGINFVPIQGGSSVSVGTGPSSVSSVASAPGAVAAVGLADSVAVLTSAGERTTVSSSGTSIPVRVVRLADRLVVASLRTTGDDASTLTILDA